MRLRKRFVALMGGALLLSAPLAAPAPAETLNELHKRALAEGGTLNFYATLAQINAEKILPLFEKRFPGIKINHIDATADKLAARAIAEARGGRTFADIFQLSLENLVQLHEQGLVLEKLPPEAAAYPDNLKGSYWLANNMIYFVGAWNTALVAKGDEPKSFDDFADAKWQGKVIAEPRDAEILIGLMHKHNSLEKAVSIVRKIAENNIEFHKGHSQLAELLVAGQAPACLTCYSHHYPRRIKQGAPLGYFLNEGIGTATPTAVVKDAPHPLTAWLFARWAASEEGQIVYAKGGRTPAHPKVEPKDRIRPAKVYAVGADDLKNFSKYEKTWKEIFELR